MFVFSHTCPVLWKSTFPIFWVSGIVWISIYREICKKNLTFECSVFSYASRTIRIHFPYVLGIILLMWRLMKKFYFWSHFHTNVYVKLFTKEVNLFCLRDRPNICISDSFAIKVWKYVQYRRGRSVLLRMCFNCNISMNMIIGIRLKIDPSGLHQKGISGGFLQLLELPLLRTHIGGFFRSVREAAVCRIFAKDPGKQTWWSPFKLKLCENSKNNYFAKGALRVSLPFVLGVSFIFPQGYRKIWIIKGEKLWRTAIAYFLPSWLWDLKTLNYNYLLFNKKATCSFIEIALQHGCSSLNLLHVFRTPFYNNIYHIWRAASEFKEIWNAFYISLVNLTPRNRSKINLLIILIIKSFC